MHLASEALVCGRLCVHPEEVRCLIVSVNSDIFIFFWFILLKPDSLQLILL